nr:retrovirus-related Pol polyprotein from transposon TNT 1-94 [Tanacetum cinerariifolium]
MAKATPTQAWLWHRRFSHLNFDYINLLSKIDIVIGLPKLKYVKDQLCSSYKLSKAKRSSFKSKVVSSSKGRLNLLHMDLCGPMRVASINGKRYILASFPSDKMRQIMTTLSPFPNDKMFLLQQITINSYNVHPEENNNDQAEEGEKLQDNEFTNPLCALTQEEAESSSHNIEQARGNPSRPVQTRRQLAIDPEMYMYALTVSTAEPKTLRRQWLIRHR